MLNQHSVFMDKFNYIRFSAKLLVENKTTMTALDLVEELNNRNYFTDRGESFLGGEGIYKLISSTYKRLVDSGNQEDADSVAVAFTKQDGSYAYN